MEKFQPEGSPNENIDEREKKFEYYLKDFPLTQEDLQKPLLDVGTGEGEFVQYVREVLGNKEAIGVDYQSRKIEPFEEGLVVADGFHLPFSDESFDVVLAHNYLPMFVDNKEKMEDATRELLRVITKGGKMMGDIATPEGVLKSKKEIKANLGDNYNKKDEERTLERYKGAQELQSLLGVLGDEGYVVETIKPSGKNKTVIVITK